MECFILLLGPPAQEGDGVVRIGLEQGLAQVDLQGPASSALL